MAAGVVGYNLKHGQIAARGTSPTYVDLPYTQTIDASIAQNSDKLPADGAKVVTAYSAPEGSGSLTMGMFHLTTQAMMTGGTASQSGTAGAAISRLEIKGSAQPPALIGSFWIPNIDGNLAAAGLRVTLPNCKFSVPSGTFDQETFVSVSADLSFDPDANDVLIIYEELATAPAMTLGVMPTNLVAPA